LWPADCSVNKAGKDQVATASCPHARSEA